MVAFLEARTIDPLSHRRIATFERRYGTRALDFACHAAFPLTLTTDLSYCLRETFFPDEPWHWAAEVLLSGLCKPVGYDLYEMEGEIRNVLLHRLLERFKEPRLWQLDRFMKAYLTHRLKVRPDEQNQLWLLGDRPHWTALACLRPDEAFALIQQELQQLVTTDDPQDRFRMAALIESYADPLLQTKFHPILLDFAKKVRAGEPIDETAIVAETARQMGVVLKPLDIEFVTIVFGDDTQAASNDVLCPFEFETVTVNRRGQEIQRESKQTFFFVERLSKASFAAEMDLENQIELLEEAVFPLTNRSWEANERLVLRAALENQTYEEIAKKNNQKSGTLKWLGRELWELLSSALGERVTKTNLAKVVDRMLRQRITQGGLQLEMVAILGGSFWMGSPKNEAGRDRNESPRHQIVVPPLFMSKYLITQAQWRAVAQFPQVKRVLDPEPSNFKDDNRPVEMVSWRDAMEFCDRLSAFTGRTYRLPTEAEWEYACRAGTTTPFHTGETITTDLANYDGRSVYRQEPEGQYRSETTEVGSFPPNAFGLCDMHGNVWEWCLDHWHEVYDSASTDSSVWLHQNSFLTEDGKRIVAESGDPLTTEDDEYRVYRGGSWDSSPGNCRSASHYGINPDFRNVDFGFRVVCVPSRTQ